MELTGDTRGWLPTGAMRWWLLGAVAVVVAASTALLVVLSWGASHRAEDRLLPGTAVADVEVGGLTASAASDRVASQLAAQLNRTVALEHDGRTWTTSLDELGATTDLDEVIDTALARLDDASVLALAQARVGSEAAVHHLDVQISLPDDAVELLVAGIAAEIDRDAVDAELDWVDGGAEAQASETGERLDKVAARELAGDLLSRDGDDPVTASLPVEVVEPDVATATAQVAAEAATAAVHGALDRPVTLELDERRWETTPRELQADPDTGVVLDAALATVRAAETSLGNTDVATAIDLDATVDDLAVPLDVDEETLTAFVASIAGEVDVPARNADVGWNGSRPAVTPAQTGRALDREAATAGLAETLDDHHRGPATVELSSYDISPTVTSAAFQQVVVLHQSRREVELWRGGEVVRSWPVAVGTGGSPTPTGSFSVGAKRFEPTWVNPAPDRWGEDMPERIGPGPDNPLGVRALNWNRMGGGDTLIRFHGTPNEASIGEAASNGCVRMFNSDVIELYDLVPSGTRILSLG